MVGKGNLTVFESSNISELNCYHACCLSLSFGVLRLSLCPSFIHSVFIKSLRLSSYNIMFFVVMLLSLLFESFLQLFCSIELVPLEA